MRLVLIGGLYVALVVAIVAFVGGAARRGDDRAPEDAPPPPQPQLEPEVRDALARHQRAEA